MVLKGSPELEHAIRDAESGILRGFAKAGKFYLNLGHFKGQASAPPKALGVVHMVGHSLPYIPPNGTFDVRLTETTADIFHKDNKGVTYPKWSGTGTSTLPPGAYHGDWVRN